MQQHTMNLRHCFPITITKVDLQGLRLVCDPISPRIYTSSVSPLMIIDELIDD